MKALLYCNKNKPYLVYSYVDWKTQGNGYKLTQSESLKNNLGGYNGFIVAECDIEVEEIKHYTHYEPEVDIEVCVLPEFTCDAYCTDTLGHFELLEKACLEDYSLPNISVANELHDNLKGKNGYAIRISNIDIFKNPWILSSVFSLNWNQYVEECLKTKGWCNHEYSKGDPTKWIGCAKARLKEAPKKIIQVKNVSGELRLLIPCSPKELCNILNGKQTILIRKRILKEMI